MPRPVQLTHILAEPVPALDEAAFDALVQRIMVWCVTGWRRFGELSGSFCVASYLGSTYFVIRTDLTFM